MKRALLTAGLLGTLAASLGGCSEFGYYDDYGYDVIYVEDYCPPPPPPPPGYCW